MVILKFCINIGKRILKFVIKYYIINKKQNLIIEKEAEIVIRGIRTDY